MGQKKTWFDQIFHPFPWNYKTPEEFFYYRGLGNALWGIPLIVGLVVGLFGQYFIGYYSILAGIISGFVSLPIIFILIGKLDTFLNKRKEIKQKKIDEENKEIESKFIENFEKKI